MLLVWFENTIQYTTNPHSRANGGGQYNCGISGGRGGQVYIFCNIYIIIFYNAKNTRERIIIFIIWKGKSN